MTIELVVTDLDGTAIPNVEWTHPTLRVVQAVQVAREAGLAVVAATGRGWRNSSELLGELGMVDPCVIGGGTRVIDPRSGEVVWSVELSDAALGAVLAAGAGLDAEVLTGDELWGEGGPARERTVADLRAAGGNIVYLEALAPSDGETVLAELAGHAELVAVMVTSWAAGRVNIHVTNPLATKAHAIGVVQELLGTSLEATVGVGDGGNDVALLSAVGLGVAMGGSPLAALGCADVVAPPVEEDGLAWVLEALVADRTGERLRVGR